MERLNCENFLEKAYRFRDRQAGVSVIFNPQDGLFTYNAYCLETKIMKELFTCEYEDLEEAVRVVNEEFSTWALESLTAEESGCGSCAAK